jgi:hypothetical protein
VLVSVRLLVRVAILALIALGCARAPKTPPFTGEPFLLVWAGDADRANSDFLAVLDADPGSPTYGKVLRTYPVRSRGNEPAQLNAQPRADRSVFGTGVLTNRTFVFDLRQPLAARLVHVDEPDPKRRFWAPGAPIDLPNGRVAVACADPARYRGDPRELLAAPGGLVLLDTGGEYIRDLPAADPAARHLIIAPYAGAVSAAVGRLVTTNAGHGYAASARGERMPGISVQIWRLDDLRLERTVVLDAGPRGEENLAPVSARFLRKHPLLYVVTEGGGVYASDSVHTQTPVFKLVYDFGAGAVVGGMAVTPDDRFMVVALTGLNRVASLDLADPWSPKAITSVRLDRDPLDPSRTRPGGPHHLTMSADGTRVVVANYTIDVPGFTKDGDHRVYVVRLDPATGRLRLDGAFVDEHSHEVGVSFDRATWPHGGTGPARPAGVLLVTPEPPQK